MDDDRFLDNRARARLGRRGDPVTETSRTGSRAGGRWRILWAAPALLCLNACAILRPIPKFNDALSPAEHLQLGLSYEAQHETAAAEREYRSALGKRRDNEAALVALGQLLFETGRAKEAEKTLARAHRLDPSNAAADNALAMVYLGGRKKLSQAERLARQASEDKSVRPYALDTLARVESAEGKTADARAALDQAKAAAPAGDPTFAAGVRDTEALINAH